jgi:hypothetical protein
VHATVDALEQPCRAAQLVAARGVDARAGRLPGELRSEMKLKVKLVRSGMAAPERQRATLTRARPQEAEPDSQF